MSLSLGFTTVFAFQTFIPCLHHVKLLLQADKESCQRWPCHQVRHSKPHLNFTLAGLVHRSEVGTQSIRKQTVKEIFLANTTKTFLNYFSSL